MSGRAFVTGVSGFAGRQLASQLVEAGWEVAGTVGARTSGVNPVTEHSVQIDDCDTLTRLISGFEPDVVFHLAAIVDTVQTPSVLELHRVNTLGTVAVTEALAAAAPAARLVYASSAFAYGHVDENSWAIPESTPLRPVTPYGASKAAGESLVHQFSRLHGAEVVVTRAFQHTGPGHTGAYALADWARQLAALERAGGGEIAVGELSVARDYLDVRDVASAYLAVAERGAPGATYNVCSGEPVTMRELLEGLIAQFDADVEIVTDESRLRKVDQPVFAGDPAALKRDTGWRREYALDQTLAALAAFWRERETE
ncbi:MAG: GDP-mannose 4,6-dehydratase [Actinobacteria bacterium]|nr:GDP-mannose 4,6-dehydratase [Actinomycetota bacterium]